MNILLSKSMKHLLLLITLSLSIYSSESILTPDPHLSISTKGFVTGKFRDFGFNNPPYELYNHGAFYGEVIPGLYFNKSNFLSLGFILKNHEFSEDDWFSFSPLIYANVGNDSTDSFFKWNFKSGILPYSTVGCGLTIKDFKRIATQASLSVGGFNFMTTLWAQGYTTLEDIYRFKLFHEKFPIKLNVLFWNIQGTGSWSYSFNTNQYYYCFYALPYIQKEWRNFDFYLEYGYKYKKEKGVSDLYGYSPHEAHGLLYGVKYIDTLFNFKIAINPEFRYYGKGFIPNTGITEKFLSNLDTWYHSTNNWIDFFNSKEKSVWLYSKFFIETPSLKGFSIYFHDELLYFRSSQKTILVEQEFGDTTFMAFNPSTNFYKAGLKYSILNYISVSFNISNQLINKDPFLDRNYANTQYMERFFPTDKLFFEILLQWQIKNLRKKKK